MLPGSRRRHPVAHLEHVNLPGGSPSASKLATGKAARTIMRLAGQLSHTIKLRPRDLPRCGPAAGGDDDQFTQGTVGAAVPASGAGTVGDRLVLG